MLFVVFTHAGIAAGVGRA